MNGLDNLAKNDAGLRVLELFAGAGGGILAGELLGHRTVCAVEFNAYARSVLLARQNDGTLPTFPIWDDVRTFDGKPWRGIVDLVSGGFPCQDISAAGKGAGIEGERSGLWGEMARIICEVRPRLVRVENSPMLTSRGLGKVLGDLAEMGFDAEWGCISAADLGANHERERIWVLATNTSNERHGWWEQQQEGFQKAIGNASDSMCVRRNESQQENGRGKAGERAFCSTSKRVINGFNEDWHKTEPRISGVDDGVANRVDRLKAIGNGQVPAVAATSFNVLSEVL